MLRLCEQQYLKKIQYNNLTTEIHFLLSLMLGIVLATFYLLLKREISCHPSKGFDSEIVEVTIFCVIVQMMPDCFRYIWFEL